MPNSSMKKLMHLSLSMNIIGAKGVNYLIKAAMPELRILNLSTIYYNIKEDVRYLLKEPNSYPKDIGLIFLN